MSRLLRAWRVVCRERGRRWADGRIVPMTHDDRPPMTTGRMGAAEWVGEEGARDRRRAPFKWGGVGVAEGDQPGMDAWHHRGAATFAYVVELHVTPDVVAMPPGGRCDAVVHPTDSTGRRGFTEESDRRAAGSNEDPTGGGEGVPGPDPPREVPATLWDGTWVTCPVGAAVAIPNATRGAAHGTDVHVALPKHGDYDWAPTLERCYRSAMDVAWGYGVSHRPGDGAHMHGKDLTPLQRTAGRANNCSAESDARAVHADPSLDAALGVVAMPLLGVGTRWGVPVSAAAAAAARAMADYEPPAHLRTRVRRGASLHLGETAPVLFGPKFSVRFAAEARGGSRARAFRRAPRRGDLSSIPTRVPSSTTLATVA